MVGGWKVATLMRGVWCDCRSCPLAPASRLTIWMRGEGFAVIVRGYGDVRLNLEFATTQMWRLWLGMRRIRRDQKRCRLLGRWLFRLLANLLFRRRQAH